MGTEKRRKQRLISGRQLPQSNDVKITILLITISTIFLLLNAPSHALRFRTFLKAIFGDRIYLKNSATIKSLQLVFQWLYFCSFSINFVLYCACAKSFRTTLISLWRRSRVSVCKSSSSSKMRNLLQVYNYQEDTKLVDFRSFKSSTKS